MNAPKANKPIGKLNCYLSVFFLLVCTTIFLLLIQRESGFNFNQLTRVGNHYHTPSSNKVSNSYKFTDFSDANGKVESLFWKNMKPSFTCPKDLLSRVGGTVDGGKWTCGLKNLGKLGSAPAAVNASHADDYESLPCIVYSFGVENDSLYEAGVSNVTDCDVYSYDPTVNTIGYPIRLNPSKYPRVRFKKLGIGEEDDGDRRTLRTLMKENGDHVWIDILKIDVEGSEYKSLERILHDFPEKNGMGLPFGQLLVEMHVWGYWMEAVDDPNNPDQILINLFKRLERRGLRMFYHEPNYRDPSCCSEFSFINVGAYSLKRFLNTGNITNYTG